DAFGILHAYDPSWLMTDSVFAMVQLEATYIGDTTGRPADDLSFSLVDGEGNMYGLHSNACHTWPFPPEDVSLEPGEQTRFNLCFVVPYWIMTEQRVYTDDRDHITVEPIGLEALIVSTNLMTDQWPVRFAIEPPSDAIPMP